MSRTKRTKVVEIDPLYNILNSFREEVFERLERRGEEDPSQWFDEPITVEYLLAQSKAEVIQLETVLATTDDTALVFRHAIDGAIALLKIAYAYGEL
jgi:hypothetical protein